MLALKGDGKRDMDGRLHDILYIRESSDLKIFSGKKIELASENIVIFKKKINKVTCYLVSYYRKVEMAERSKACYD